MSKPVTISRSSASKLPNSWSNRGRDEYLHPDAYASLSNALNVAVADKGVNFQIWDALRDMDEQVAMLKKNYRRVSRGRSRSSDRTWDGSTWEKRPGRPNTASPGWSNHGSGRAIDVHPGPIQDWFREKGAAWGWSVAEGQRNGEAWHVTFTLRNRYADRGVLDHAWVQKVVGVKVDGKIGTGTVAAIKKWQKANGLDADGIVGPGTAKAMGLSGKGESAPAPSAPAPAVKSPAKATPGWMPGASKVQTFSGNSHKAPVTKIVLHTTEGSSWPGYNNGGAAPHFTVHRDGTIRQHIPTTQSSKALVNKSGGVETNNAGVIQIEYIGSCDRAYAAKHNLFFTENANDADLAGLASVLAWINAAHGVPLTVTGLSWPTTNAAYASAPQRFSFSAWEAYKGVCGHTHVPENDHWDPGAFPITRLLKLAGGAAPVAPAPSKPAPAKSGKVDEDGRAGRETIAALQRALGVDDDGRAGEGTWRALQRKLSVKPADGKIGWQSYRPHELGNGIVDRKTAWGFTGRGSKGSPTVKALQKHVGMAKKDQDGIWHDATSLAIQKALNAGKF